MKTIEQSVEITTYTPDPERHIERYGRIAHKSEDKITADSHVAFIRKIMKMGHESVLEHASASLLIVTDRGISHELVRHRIASFTQESTRYCAYADEITVIEPPDLPPLSGFTRWDQACWAAEKAYKGLLANGCKPEIARSVLPTCLKTEIVMTANLREWRHILRLRLAKAAHPQMRELAGMIRDRLIEIAPTCFEEFMTPADWAKAGCEGVSAKCV